MDAWLTVAGVLSCLFPLGLSHAQPQATPPQAASPQPTVAAQVDAWAGQSVAYWRTKERNAELTDSELSVLRFGVRADTMVDATHEGGKRVRPLVFDVTPTALVKAPASSREARIPFSPQSQWPSEVAWAGLDALPSDSILAGRASGPEREYLLRLAPGTVLLSPAADRSQRTVHRVEGGRTPFDPHRLGRGGETDFAIATHAANAAAVFRGMVYIADDQVAEMRDRQVTAKITVWIDHQHDRPSLTITLDARSRSAPISTPILKGTQHVSIKAEFDKPMDGSTIVLAGLRLEPEIAAVPSGAPSQPSPSLAEPTLPSQRGK